MYKSYKLKKYVQLFLSGDKYVVGIIGIVIHAGFEMESLDIGNLLGIDMRQIIGRSYRRLNQNLAYRILHHFLSHLRNGKFGQELT